MSFGVSMSISPPGKSERAVEQIFYGEFDGHRKRVLVKIIGE